MTARMGPTRDLAVAGGFERRACPARSCARLRILAQVGDVAMCWSCAEVLMEAYGLRRSCHWKEGGRASAGLR
jgi:hypothetical protein